MITLDDELKEIEYIEHLTGWLSTSEAALWCNVKN